MPVLRKYGRFGPYVQMGEQEEGSKEKPKRAGMREGWVDEELTCDKAMMLLSLPRDVGPHPDDGETITATIGRFGPYVKHGKTSATLPSVDDVFEIGINRAVSIIADKIANPGRGRGQAAKPIHELGAHPETGEPVNVFDGRYGPYVKHMKTNATIPRDMKPEDVTLDLAVTLLAERDAKGPAKKKKKATKKKATKKGDAPAEGSETTGGDDP